MIHVGTSGWQYDDWTPGFYPEGLPRTGWLRWFADRFSSVEVNNTFYRLPGRSTFERWRDETPDGFVIAVKASRYLTHLRRLREPEEPLRRLLDAAAGLGPRLGPILFQLPPRFPAEPTRLSQLLGLLPGGLRAAFEFRDPSWQTDEVHGMLGDAGAALVLADRPGTRLPERIVGGWTYVRFHQGQRLGPDYPRAKLRRWADRLAELHVDDAYVYFNNDTGGAAIRDAAAFSELLEERGLPVPARSAAHAPERPA
jgi:uncharacterized protein YecE (DUF72 family)